MTVKKESIIAIKADPNDPDDFDVSEAGVEAALAERRARGGGDGRVHDCVTVQSSGAPILDAAACKLITGRGRYRPALGADGKPVEVPKALTFSWWLPS